MHQAHCIGARDGTGVELALLPDERCDQVWVKPLGLGAGREVAPERLGEQQLPILIRHFADGQRVETNAAAFDCLQCANVFAVAGVNLRFGERAPLRTGAAGLDLRRNVFVQRGVGKQACLDQVRIVFR